MLIQDPL